MPKINQRKFRKDEINAKRRNKFRIKFQKDEIISKRTGKSLKGRKMADWKEKYRKDEINYKC